MALNFHGKVPKVKFLSNITGKQFEEEYEKISSSPDMAIVASLHYPEQLEGSNKFNCFIFYELPAPKKEEAPVELKMDL